VVVERQSELLQIILTRSASGRLPSFLHRRQKKRNKYGDDSNDHEHLDQRKSAART
jgi:hypothetical protein